MLPHKVLAVAGIAGPVVFTVLVIVQGILQPDYNHIRMPISALAAWPLGWVQETNFLILGLSMIALAYGLHITIRPAREAKRGGASASLLAMGGIGVIVAAAFSWKMVDGVATEPPPHVVGAITAFAGTGLGFMRLGSRMENDPKWKDLARFTRIAGMAVLVLFIGVGFLASTPSAPLNQWLGLVQRGVFVVWFSGLIVLSLRMRRV